MSSRLQAVTVVVAAVVVAAVIGAWALVVEPGQKRALAERAAVSGSASPEASEPVSATAALASALRGSGPVKIYGMGSSVGVGATLPDPATQAPAAHLGAALDAVTDAPVEVHNLSVNGSTAQQGLDLWRSTVRAAHPTVLLLAYGMNDGLTGAYNSGQTLPGGIRALRSIAAEAAGDGVVVLIATTPSPRTTADFSLPAGLPVLYPVQGGAVVPAEPFVRVGGAPFSARHAEWNREAAKVAADTGAVLLDVAPSWAAAVASQGEGAVFNGAEFVHPNLTGHKASYWAAIDAFVRTVK